MTGRGGEGMIVKPLSFVARGPRDIEPLSEVLGYRIGDPRAGRGSAHPRPERRAQAHGPDGRALPLRPAPRPDDGRREGRDDGTEAAGGARGRRSARLQATSRVGSPGLPRSIPRLREPVPEVRQLRPERADCPPELLRRRGLLPRLRSGDGSTSAAKPEREGPPLIVLRLRALGHRRRLLRRLHARCVRRRVPGRRSRAGQSLEANRLP
ncbi:MAG: hypothetical protein KF894_03755 [Labilithrix sp.]|nr:hypothetical protein [Labilithrix sp.]